MISTIIINLGYGSIFGAPMIVMIRCYLCVTHIYVTYNNMVDKSQHVILKKMIL